MGLNLSEFLWRFGLFIHSPRLYFLVKFKKYVKFIIYLKKNGKMWVLILTTICSGVLWIFYYMGSLLPEIYDFLAVL